MRTYIARRFPDLIHLFVPHVYVGGVRADSYELLNAANWDGVFASVATVPMTGFISRNAYSQLYKTSGSSAPGRDGFYITFVPSDLGLIDGDPLFFRLEPSLKGVAQPQSEVFVILPYSEIGKQLSILVLEGTSVGPVQIRLPFASSAIDIKTGSTVDVAFAFGGTPITVTTTTPFTSTAMTTSELELSGAVTVVVTLAKSSFP